MDKTRFLRSVLVVALLVVGYSALPLLSSGASEDGVVLATCCLFGRDCPDALVCCSYERLGLQQCDPPLKPHYCVALGDCPLPAPVEIN